MQQKSIGSALDKIKHLLKRLSLPVIWIRHRASSVIRKIHEQTQLVPMCRRTLTLKITQIVLVHRQQEVEVKEIFCTHLPSTQGTHIITTRGACRTGTHIGSRADVVIPCAGRIHQHLIMQTCGNKALLKNGMCSG